MTLTPFRKRQRIDMARPRSQPLVYACSGCSSAAQMANYVAICLDRAGLAEMSCIAGVGGDVPSLVKLAKSGRPVVAIDGCKLHCARSCLSRHGVEPAPQGGWVRIRTRRRRGQALVSVTNSLPPGGQPGQSRGGHGIALRNVKERLRLMHDVTADFAAGPEGDTWRVQIAVPLA